MKYDVKFITEVDYGEKKGNIALLFLPGVKLSQYAVVRNIDLGRDDSNDDLWDSGSYFPHTPQGLQGAIDLYRYRTEENYISRTRLEELATNFKDYALEQLEECELEATRDMIDRYDISDYEAGFFGFETEDEDNCEDSFKGLQYNKMDDLYNGCEE